MLCHAVLCCRRVCWVVCSCGTSVLGPAQSARAATVGATQAVALWTSRWASIDRCVQGGAEGGHVPANLAPTRDTDVQRATVTKLTRLQNRAAREGKAWCTASRCHTAQIRVVTSVCLAVQQIDRVILPPCTAVALPGCASVPPNAGSYWCIRRHCGNLGHQVPVCTPGTHMGPASLWGCQSGGLL